MIKIGTFYNNIKKNHGKDVATTFYRLMQEWEGITAVSNIFYAVDTLNMKREEAIEHHFEK